MSLQKIQQRLKAPKNQFNSFGKYKYRNQEDILEALKPLLAEYEYALTISDKIVEIGNRVYVKATARLQGADGGMIAEVTAYAREAESKKGMDESQVTGAASSYARKYALNGMFLIDDTKDADSMEPENGGKKAESKAESTSDGKITDAQLKKLNAMLGEHNMDRIQVKLMLRVASLKELTKDRAKKLFDEWSKFVDLYNERQGK